MDLEQRQFEMRERQLAARPPHEPDGQTESFSEKHYTVAEIAALWELGEDLIRKLFMNESGVLVIGGDESKPGTRRYRTLRIPKSVAARVHKRLSNFERSKC